MKHRRLSNPWVAIIYASPIVFDMLFIYCNWVSSRWYWSVDLYKNREGTTIYKSLNNTQNHTQTQNTQNRKQNI